MNEEFLERLVADLQFMRLEAVLGLGSIILLLVGLVIKSSTIIRLLYFLILVVAIYLNRVLFLNSVPFLSGSVSGSQQIQLFNSVLLFAGFLLIVFKEEKKHTTEFYFLVLSLILGGVLMMKANSFLVLFLAIELTSFVGYILTNFSFSAKSHEAAIKYLLFGATSSAIMLFGLGMIYIDTGVFYLTELGGQISLVTSVGLLFVIGGLLFKISIAPYHIWVPAVYQSAPSKVVAILSIVPKIAGLVILGKLFLQIPQVHWLTHIVYIFGAITMILGTLGAVNQSQFRRMIGFGAIAHSGFLLPLVLIHSELAEQTFWYYSIAYVIMNYAIFYFADEMEDVGIEAVSDYSKLGNGAIAVTISLTLVMVSLVGVPPLAGFTAKFLLFTTLFEQYLDNGNWLFAAYLIVAILLTVVSLFFYLQAPYQIFLKGKQSDQSINFSFQTKIIATLFSIVLLLLFFVPEILTLMQQLLKATNP